MQKKISIFSFFAGIGILDLAFEKSGYNIVFVNEYDDLFMASYQYARTQMTHLVPLYGYHNDSAERYAKKRGKRKLINLVAKEREKGNLVGFIGGPPCPDFSVAGKNAGVVGENGRLTMEQSAECEEKLTALLEDKEKALLLRLINAENEIGSTMALENFILGFRLGVRMILEALDEDDGSLLDPNKEG